MTFLKRLRVLPAVLGVVATLAAIGTSLFGDMRRGSVPPKPGETIQLEGNRVSEDLAVTKFSKLSALTYQLRDGELLFAWQIRPVVAPSAPRSRDILVLV